MPETKNQQAPRRAYLDTAKKQEMMAILVRNQLAFEEVRDTFTVRHAKFISEGMGLVWKKVQTFYDKYSELPDKGTLEAEISDAITADPNLVPDDEIGDLNEFIEYAWDEAEHGKDISKSKTHRKVAVETAKVWINEVTARSLQETLLKDGSVPEDMTETLEKVKTELEIAGALTDVELDVPFPEGWDTRERVRLFTTGCTPLDDFRGGGWRGGEVVLFMGPYGSCKTTLVCNCVANLILHASKEYTKALARWEKKGKVKKKPKRPVVVLIFTEGDKDTYRCRLLAHLAQVPWKKLATMKSVKSLSNSTKPGQVKTEGENIGTEYEKEEFKKALADGQGFLSERQRVKEAVEMANLHLVLIDCTDSDDTATKIGRGGIPEIATVVRAHFRKHEDTKPLCFWIDHVSALADRMCEAGGKDYEDRLTRILSRMPLQAGDRLAKPWKVPVGLLHQLSGEANLRGVTAKFHHADSEGSKSIGKYVDFAVCTGPTDSDKMCVWDVTKHRREPPMARKVIEVQGNFQRIIDRSSTHHVPPGARSIMARSESEHHTALKKHGTHGQSGSEGPGYKAGVI